MASPTTASKSTSGEGTTNVPRSDFLSADDLGYLDISSDTFLIYVCNIRGVVPRRDVNCRDVIILVLTLGFILKL